MSNFWENIRKPYTRKNELFSKEEDKQMLEAYLLSYSINNIAKALKRNYVTVSKRLAELLKEKIK